MYLSNRYKNDLECLKMLDIDFVLNLMDARLALESDKNTYDIVFLDGFTPSKSPSLWSYDFIKLLTEHLNDNSVILTYTSAAPVRNAFLSCDLNVGNIISKNNEIIGTIASKNKNLILNELSEFDLGLVKTKSGIMYLDKNLSASDEEILSDRNQRVLSSNLVSASSYKRHYDKP